MENGKIIANAVIMIIWSYLVRFVIHRCNKIAPKTINLSKESRHHVAIIQDISLNLSRLTMLI